MRISDWSSDVCSSDLAVSSAPAIAPAASAAGQLRALLAQSDEADMKRNPLNALYRGDMRYAGQFGDYLSDAYLAAERAAAEEDLRQLADVDRSRLSPTDQVIHDTFKWQRTLDLRGLQPDFALIGVQLPLEHFHGMPICFPDLSSG